MRFADLIKDRLYSQPLNSPLHIVRPELFYSISLIVASTASWLLKLFPASSFNTATSKFSTFTDLWRQNITFRLSRLPSFHRPAFDSFAPDVVVDEGGRSFAVAVPCPPVCAEPADITIKKQDFPKIEFLHFDDAENRINIPCAKFLYSGLQFVQMCNN